MASPAISNRYILETALRTLNVICLQQQQPNPADEARLRQIAADQTTPIDELACLVIQNELRQRKKIALSRVGSDLKLTPREKEVLVLIAQGLSTKQVACQLGISFKTAACHRSRVMDKLGVHETASLVRYAIRQQLIAA